MNNNNKTFTKSPAATTKPVPSKQGVEEHYVVLKKLLDAAVQRGFFSSSKDVIIMSDSLESVIDQARKYEEMTGDIKTEKT